ncbi:MAG: cupin domain-containing protein, partial [Anaerolineales bacterium]
MILVASPYLAAQSNGQVLKRGEGELLDLPIGPWIIKAGPETGTQGAELHMLDAVPGFSTGLHVHFDKDEFFYVVEGQGSATIDEKETPIGKGDVLFIPKGHDHRVSNT